MCIVIRQPNLHPLPPATPPPQYIYCNEPCWICCMLTVENYEKGEVREIEEQVEAITTDANAIHMQVNVGSKIRNLMAYATKKFKVCNNRT